MTDTGAPQNAVPHHASQPREARGPGDTGEISGHEGQATETAHPIRPKFCKRPPTRLHATLKALAVDELAHLQQDA